MGFRIEGLDPKPFAAFYGLPDVDLAAHGVTRVRVDASPGFPDRVEVRDLEIGETALLLNFTHQPADTAYRSSHAIFVLEGAQTAFDAIDEIPEVMRRRVLSLRAFDTAGMMVEADLIDGQQIEGLIGRMFADRRVDYVHAHYAKRGCYAARISRA